MDLPVYKSPFPRSRHSGVKIQRAVGDSAVYTNTTSTKQVFTTVTDKQAPLAFLGEHLSMQDVVTPGYKARQSSGQVINNPMTRYSVKCSYGGKGPDIRYTDVLNPWPGAGWTVRWDLSSFLLRTDLHFLLGDILDDNHNPIPGWEPSIDYERLVTQAHTSALSKVDRNTAYGLVTLGEFTKTLDLVLHPLQSMRRMISEFWNNTSRKRRINAARRAGPNMAKQLPTVLASEYLAFYYGMQPLIGEVTSYLEAYYNEGNTPERVTARGGATDDFVREETVYGDRTARGANWFDIELSTRVTANVRAGILYAPTQNTALKVLGLRPSDFFSSAYELAPWSFFIDYFSNLGTLIEALTPRPGVSYLAAWECIDIKQVDRVQCIASGHNNTAQFTHARQGSEWAERVIEMHVRRPTSAASNLGLVTSFGNWDSKLKVAAVISLAIQQLGKFLPRL